MPNGFCIVYDANSKKARTFCMSVQALRKYSSGLYIYEMCYICLWATKGPCALIKNQSLHHLHPSSS